MSSEPEYEVLRHRICEEIHTLIGALASGIVNEREFTEMVLCIEQEKASPHGFTLISANTRDDWTHLTLKSNRTKRVCAVFEFHPQTGRFRRLGQWGPN